jgi:hypothetical protein
MKTSEKRTISSTPRAPRHEAIAQLAYEFWQKKGRPTGCDLDIWLDAERAFAASANRTTRRSRISPAVEAEQIHEQTDALLANFGTWPRHRSPTSL